MRFYKVSVLLNIIGLVLALFLGYYFRNDISRLIWNSNQNNKLTEDKPLPQIREQFYQQVVKWSEEASFDYSKGSLEDWRKWRDGQQSKLNQMLGKMPERLPKLTADVVEVLEIQGVILERIILCGEKDVEIPSYFFHPQEIKGKCPGILFFTGHNAGLEEIVGVTEDYQHNAPLELAKNGYAVYVIENRSFGERAYKDFDHVAYAEFLMSCGSSYPAALIFDARLALDYIVSRPEVDAEKIGATGCSLGGVISVMLAARDDRIKCAVIYGAFNTALNNRMMNDPPCCPCFVLPGVLQLEPFVFYTGVAPRKLCIAIGDADPILPEDQVKKYFSQLKKAWDINNAGENISLYIHQGGHEIDNAHAVQTFNKWLKNQ